MNQFTRTLAVMGSILGLFVASGNAVAQPAKAKTATTFIGTLPAEPPARVAIALEGDTFLAYACGQTDDFNKSAPAWFKGVVKNGRIEATADGKKFSATLDNGTIRGSLTANCLPRCRSPKIGAGKPSGDKSFS